MDSSRMNLPFVKKTILDIYLQVAGEELTNGVASNTF